jgi:hypothetical protein
LSLVQGPFPVAPCQALISRFATFSSQYTAVQEATARTGTGRAPTPPDKMPAPRFRYSPIANPQSCRDARLARAPHNASPRRGRLHVQAGTGRAPTPPDKMPEPRFKWSATCAWSAAAGLPMRQMVGRPGAHSTSAHTSCPRELLRVDMQPPSLVRTPVITGCSGPTAAVTACLGGNIG